MKTTDLLLGQIKSISRTHPESLKTEWAAEMLDSCVAVVDYYDRLADPRYEWLFSLARLYYENLISDARSVPDEWLTVHFRFALIHLQIDYRRRSIEHAALTKRFAQLEWLIPLICSRNTATSFRLARRYFHLRAHVVRQVPEKHQAEKFLDLATSCADIEETLVSDKADLIEVLDDKIISLGITRVWLQISRGNYTHALQLLKMVSARLDVYQDDPIFYAKYLVAKNISLRALAGRNEPELRQVIQGLTEALNIFDNLEDRRHLLRCYYERSMCYLLLGDQGKVARDLRFMERFAHAGGENRLGGWRIQLNIMRSRLACQAGDYIQAHASAFQAMSLAVDLRLDLLAIEAKNTLAMILFRQGKLSEAETHLNDALRLNHEGLQQTDHSDLSQPALYAVSVLYLARVAFLRHDAVAALAWLQKWRNVKPQIEHQWVRTLSAEIEHQALHECLLESESSEAEEIDFEGHLRLLRKVLIERASRKLKSKKIIDIARELKVNRQTVHLWLKDLREQKLSVELRVD
jgi:tetratricopeptide (TPR) repeat protein